MTDGKCSDPSTKPLSVLLVDDDEQVRSIAARILRKRGYTTLESEDEDSALAAMAREPADVLMTDVTMAGIGGVDLAVAMRAAHPKLAVVFVSGAPLEVEVLERVPGAAYVRKPFRIDALAAAVEQALSASRAIVE